MNGIFPYDVILAVPFCLRIFFFISSLLVVVVAVLLLLLLLKLMEYVKCLRLQRFSFLFVPSLYAPAQQYFSFTFIFTMYENI